MKKKILMVGPLPPTVGGITTFIMEVLNSKLNNKYSFIGFGTERPTYNIVRQSSDYTLIFRVTGVFSGMQAVGNNIFRT